MTLASGTRLGPYEVLSPIGAGGMGCRHPLSQRRLIVSSHGVLTLQDISKDGRVLVDCANERLGLLGLSAADAKERDLSGLDWSRSRVDVASGHRELWKEFTSRDPTGVTDISADAITPDGKTLVFAYHHILSDLYVVEGLK